MPTKVFLSLPDEVQDKILLAAAEVLHQKGLRMTTFQDVAEHAQLNQETAERYFNGINGLVASVLGRGLQYFNQAYIQIGETKAPFWARLRLLLRIAAERGNRFGIYLNLYLNIGGAGLPDLAKATFDRFEGRAALFFQNFILSGIQEGALRDDLDAVSVALHFQDVTRLAMSRRAHPIYAARSEAYFKDIPLDDKGDALLIERLVEYLQTLYSTT